MIELKGLERITNQMISIRTLLYRNQCKSLWPMFIPITKALYDKERDLLSTIRYPN